MNRRTQRNRRTLSIRNRNLAALVGAVGAMIVQHHVQANTYFWDANNSHTGVGGGGTGVWNTGNNNWYPGSGATDGVWGNQPTDFAQFSGSGGVVSVGESVNVNRMTFTTTNYSVTFAGGTINFGGAAPEFDINAGSVVISAPITGMGTPAVPLTVNASAANTLVLSGSNSFSGTNFVVNNGKVALTTVANQITGSDSLTKSGAGSLSLTNGGNNNTGNWTINAGVLEAQQPTSLGQAGVTVTVNGDGSTSKSFAGELVISNMTDNHAVTLAGGIMSGDGGTANYANAITVTADSHIRLGDFFQNTNRNLIISGPLSGSGNLGLLNGGSLGAAAPTGQELILSGDNHNYTGTITADGGHNVRFDSPSATFSGGQMAVASSDTAMGGVIIGNVNVAIPTIIDSTGKGGVFGLGNGITYTTPIDLSTIAGGGFELGADSGGGTYSATTIGAGTGNVYRLGGGNGILTIASDALADNANQASAVIGDARTNGGGTVIFLGDETYTGGTTIAGGTLQIGNGGTSGSFLGDATINTGANLAFNRSDTVSFSGAITNNGLVAQNGAGVLNLTGTITNNGTLQVNPNSTAGIAGAIALGSTGTVNVNGGTLQLNAGGSLGSNLLLTGGSVVINGANTDSTVLSTTIGNGSSKITGAFAGGNALNLGNITRAPGGVVDFSLTTGNVTSSTANANFSGGQQSIFGGYATVNGTTWAVTGTSGTNTISGLTTYDTNFTAGTDVDMTPDGGTQPTASGTVNSIRFNSPGAYTINTGGNITVATGGILENANVGANAVQISGNQLTTGNGSDLIIIQNNTAAAMTIGSSIPATGTAGLTKAGAGALVLASANAFTGPLRINGGTVSISAVRTNWARTTPLSSSTAACSVTPRQPHLPAIPRAPIASTAPVRSTSQSTAATAAAGKSIPTSPMALSALAPSPRQAPVICRWAKATRAASSPATG